MAQGGWLLVQRDGQTYFFLLASSSTHLEGQKKKAVDLVKLYVVRLIYWRYFPLSHGAFLPLPNIQDSFCNVDCGGSEEFQSPEQLRETANSGDSVLDFTLDLDDDMVSLAWRRTQV